MNKRFAKHKANLKLLFYSLLIAVLMSELILRLFLPAPVIWKYPQEKYMYDPEIGHWLVHGQLAFSHDKIVRTNSMGIRDSDYQPEASPGVYRILALGDSQTFGNGLELEDTWPKQLEKMLNNSDEMRTEVINGGIPATDTWQHEIILQRLLAAYNPDEVILALYVNDVVRSFTPVPVQEKTRNRILVQTINMFRRSVLLLTINSVIQGIGQKRSTSWHTRHQKALLMGETNPEVRERLAQAERSLSGMKNICDARNIDFRIIALPRRDQVDGRIPWNGYYSRIESIADKYGIPVTSMQEPLHEAYRQYGKKLFIPWDGHNSKFANQVIAREAIDAQFTSR